MARRVGPPPALEPPDEREAPPYAEAASATYPPPPARADERNFWLVLGGTAAFLFPLLLILTTGSDYWFYLGIGQLSNLGFYPYLHYWLEYPPVFPWLTVAIYRFALTFPPTIFSDFNITFHLLLGAVFVAADLATIALVYRIALRTGPRDEALRRMILYAALFWPVAVAFGWYDALPAAMLFAGLYLLLRGEGGWGGVAAGLGFMTKIFPILLVPVSVKFLPRWRDRVLTVLAAAAVTLAIAAPLVVISPTYFLASYRATFSRSAWETVWALLDGYYSYGKTAPLGVRFDPTTAGYIAYQSRVPGLPIALFFVALYAVLWLRPVRRTARNLALFTALSALVFLLYSKGYSPQFIIYLLPFVVILLPWRRAVGYALALSGINILEWPIYHEWLGQVHWVLAVVVIARTLVWLALGWEWLAELWGLRDPLRTLDRRVVVAGATALVVAAIPASVLAWQSWTAAYYQSDDLRPASDFIQRYALDDGVAFVFADDDLYQHFYPLFGRRGDFYLFRPVDTDGITIKEPSLTEEGHAAMLARLAATHGQIFFVRKADDWTSADINAWLTQHAKLGASMRVEDVDVSVWQLPPPGVVPIVAPTLPAPTPTPAGP